MCSMSCLRASAPVRHTGTVQRVGRCCEAFRDSTGCRSFVFQKHSIVQESNSVYCSRLDLIKLCTKKKNWGMNHYTTNRPLSIMNGSTQLSNISNLYILQSCTCNESSYISPLLRPFSVWLVLWEALAEQYDTSSATIMHMVIDQKGVFSSSHSQDKVSVLQYVLIHYSQKLERQVYCFTSFLSVKKSSRSQSSLQWLWIFHSWLCICIMELWAQPCYVFSGPLGRPLLDCN